MPLSLQDAHAGTGYCVSLAAPRRDPELHFAASGAARLGQPVVGIGRIHTRRPAATGAPGHCLVRCGSVYTDMRVFQADV